MTICCWYADSKQKVTIQALAEPPFTTCLSRLPKSYLLILSNFHHLIYISSELRRPYSSRLIIHDLYNFVGNIGSDYNWLRSNISITFGFLIQTNNGGCQNLSQTQQTLVCNSQPQSGIQVFSFSYSFEDSTETIFSGFVEITYYPQVKTTESRCMTVTWMQTSLPYVKTIS